MRRQKSYNYHVSELESKQYHHQDDGSLLEPQINYILHSNHIQVSGSVDNINKLAFNLYQERLQSNLKREVAI